MPLIIGSDAQFLGKATIPTPGVGSDILSVVNKSWVQNQNYLSLNDPSLVLSNDFEFTQPITVSSGNSVFQDLQIMGTLTYSGPVIIDPNNINLEGPILTVNTLEGGAGVTGVFSGLEIERGTEDNVRWVWDENEDVFKGTDSVGTTLKNLKVKDISANFVTLANAPTNNSHAVTKVYVDTHDWLSSDITDFQAAVEAIVDVAIVAQTTDSIQTTYNPTTGDLESNLLINDTDSIDLTISGGSGLQADIKINNTPSPTNFVFLNVDSNGISGVLNYNLDHFEVNISNEFSINTTWLDTYISGSVGFANLADITFEQLDANGDVADPGEYAANKLSPANHHHNITYAQLNHNHESEGWFTDHVHDDRYYTETEVDNLIAGISGGTQSTGFFHETPEIDETGLGGGRSIDIYGGLWYIPGYGYVRNDGIINFTLQNVVTTGWEYLLLDKSKIISDGVNVVNASHFVNSHGSDINRSGCPFDEGDRGWFRLSNGDRLVFAFFMQNGVIADFRHMKTHIIYNDPIQLPTIQSTSWTQRSLDRQPFFAKEAQLTVRMTESGQTSGQNAGNVEIGANSYESNGTNPYGAHVVCSNARHGDVVNSIRWHSHNITGNTTTKGISARLTTNSGSQIIIYHNGYYLPRGI